MILSRLISGRVISRRTVRVRRRAGALAAATLVIGGCGSGSTGDGAGDADDADADGGRPTVIATTSIWADITSDVLCGEPVAALVPVGADPHTFEPSLRDRELIEAADLIVANGGGLEESLVDLVATALADDAHLVEITPHVDVITLADDETHDDETHDDETHDDETHDDETHEEGDEGAAGDDGHGHGLDADPHVWQDPTRVAGALDVIASAGTAIGLPDCSDDVEAELMALDAEIAGLLADVPPSQRVMVTSHDSLAYFADRYDLEVVGTVIPSTSTLAATNAADLAALADLIDQRDVRVIFTEQLESTADADALAARLGVDVVPLVTDALTADTASYAEMMRANATSIAEALAP